MRLKLSLIIPLILALLFFFNPIIAADDFDPWSYDSNYDGIMSKSEALVAVADYFAEEIPKWAVLEIIAWYYEGVEQ